MTTEPTDLRERIARALAEHWRDMHTNEALGQQRMLADAVLPIVRAAQAEAAEDAVQRVRALHEHRAPEPPYVEYCEHCGADWPCQTVRVLDGDE